MKAGWRVKGQAHLFGVQLEAEPLHRLTKLLGRDLRVAAGVPLAEEVEHLG
jgi:hypothetical protein